MLTNKEKLIDTIYNLFVDVMLLKKEISEDEKHKPYTKLVIRYVLNILEDTIEAHKEKQIELLFPCMIYTIDKKKNEVGNS